MSDQTTNTAPDEEVKRLVQAARDAVTDDMVARLAENAGQALDLLDRVNRSGVDRALPAIAELVHSGDLDRLVRLARVYGSAEDAVTDEMVGRLAETVGGGISLLDQVNRADLAGALPVLSRMVADGDLERLAQFARMIGAAQDAVTDDMVGRLAEVIGEGVSVVDRLNRSGVNKLIDILERLSSSGALDKIADALPRLVDQIDLMQALLTCMENASKEAKSQPPSTGGVMELLRIMRQPENQDVMRFALAMGRHMRAACTDRVKG